MTLRLKSCPKCHGDVRFDRDQYGWYEQCIQCGFVRDLESMELIWRDCATLASWRDDGRKLKPITPFGSAAEYHDKGLH